MEEVTQQGKVCVLDIDVQGAKLVAAADLDAYFVFIEPPSLEELELRLRGAVLLPKRDNESSIC